MHIKREQTAGETRLRRPAPETAGRLIRWAHHYDAVVNLLALGKAQAFRRATIDLAHIQPGEQVLDVGCGTGDLTIRAKTGAGPAGRVVGIDASPEMIDLARRKAARADVDVDFRIEIVEQMPFPDGSFDVALSSLMMHHLPDDLKRRGLLEIRRVLKPGGRVLIVDARRPESRTSRVLMALLLHRSIQTGVQDLPALLPAAGFTDVESGNTSFGPIGFVRGRAV